MKNIVKRKEIELKSALFDMVEGSIAHFKTRKDRV